MRHCPSFLFDIHYKVCHLYLESCPQVIFSFFLIAGLNISTGAKNRVMSDESCFATDTVVQCEVKKNYMLRTSQTSEAFGKHRPFLLCFLFLWTFQYTVSLCRSFKFKIVRCILIKKFYANTLLFFAWDNFSFEKHFICHCTALKT